ncbi:hypothetical protein AB4Z18_02525 [Leifsonia sp. 2TAF2]|uniref:hypothetical protein n=1 Tax=Leifsonia sp. 2TAF2 TaxID=3233009 RepID=UPI003F9D9498
MVALIPVALVLAVAAVGGLAIWLMERSRRRVISTEGVVGTVREKRHVDEHGELRLPYRGAGGGDISVAPESYVLGIQTTTDYREIVVDRDVFDAFQIGDVFPGANRLPRI